VRLDRRTRTAVAAAIGLGTAALVYWHLSILEPETLGFDFTWPWRAARALIAGENPYHVIQPTGPFPFDGTFNYPLPAALIAMPFAWLTPAVAAALFSGISGGLLSFALSERGWHRLIVLVSPPYLITAMSGQWSTLMMAAALMPALSWLIVAKPTVGLASFAFRPNRYAIIGGMALLGISFAVLPTWLGDWVTVLRHEPSHRYMPLLMLRGGPVLLLALLRWRTPEGRFLAVVACVPQVLTSYSAFPLMLAARTRLEALTLSTASVIAWAGFRSHLGNVSFDATRPVYMGNWILWCIALPALAMTLARPNEGRIPSRLEELIALWPKFVRGRESSLQQRT
jgi:hypothetical protein